MTSRLSTRFLGQIIGRTEDGVTQYLGVKYANLKNRLADAEPIENRDGDALDATNDGFVINPNNKSSTLTFDQVQLPCRPLRAMISSSAPFNTPCLRKNFLSLTSTA